MTFKSYHERKADEAYNAFAAAFVVRAKAEYKKCKTSSDLHKLSKSCWKEANQAAATINRNGYDNFTRHGTMNYDKYDALYTQARSFAIEFYKKAKRIDSGEKAEIVMPHLNNP